MTDDLGPPTVAKPTAFYGVIQSAVSVRATTAETWADIRQYATRNNLQLPPGMLASVNGMRALAAGNRNASEVLNKARDSDYVTGRMVGAQIFARSADRRAAGLLYRADFAVTTKRAGVTQVDHYSLQYGDYNLPSTVGQLRQDVNEYAYSLGGIYGVDVVDVSDIAIGAF